MAPEKIDFEVVEEAAPKIDFEVVADAPKQEIDFEEVKEQPEDVEIDIEDPQAQLEGVRRRTEAAKQQAKQAEFEQQLAEQAQAEDPRNWTILETKERFKKFPAKTPEEEAAREEFLNRKLLDKAEEISNRQRQAVITKVKTGQRLTPAEWDFYLSDKYHSELTPAPPTKAFTKLLKSVAKGANIIPSEEHRRARAANTLAISEVTGMSLDEVDKRYDDLVHDPRIIGIETGGEHTVLDAVEAAITPLVVVGVAGDVITMAAGKPPVVIPTLAAFGLLDKVFPVREKLEELGQRGEITPEFRDFASLMDFVVKGKVAHGIGAPTGRAANPLIQKALAPVRKILERRAPKAKLEEVGLGLPPKEVPIKEAQVKDKIAREVAQEIEAPKETKKPVEKPTPEPVVPEAKPAETTFTAFDRRRAIVEDLRESISQGEAGRRIQTEEGEFIGIPSTFPEFFKNKGYTKKETLNIIDKFLTGKRLTRNQKEIFQDLFREQERIYNAEIAAEAKRLGLQEGATEQQILEAQRAGEAQARGDLAETGRELPSRAGEFDPAKLEAELIAELRPGDLARVRGKTVSLQGIEGNKARVISDAGKEKIVPASEVSKVRPEEVVDLPEVVAARERAGKIPETFKIDTPERQALRSKLIDEFYGEGAPVKNRRADIVLGGPATGKTLFADSITKKQGSLLIDSDNVKVRLPEYDNGFGASAVHKESSNIIEAAVFERALEAGDNIVLARLGKNKDTLAGLIKQLKANDYDVHLTMVDLPIEKAMQRTVNRFLERGRFVDPLYVQSIGLKPTHTYDILKTGKEVKSYVKYSTDTAAKGDPPKVLEFSSEAARRERGLQREQLAPSGDAGGGEAPPTAPARELFPELAPTKERKFIKTVREAEKTAPEVAEIIQGRYQQLPNEVVVKRAKRLIELDPDKAQQIVESQDPPSALSNTVALLLQEKAQAEGRWTDAKHIIESMAKKATPYGQAIQVLSLYAKLTPEGIARYADGVIREAQVKMPQGRLRMKNFEKLLKNTKTEKDRVKLAKKLGVPYLSEANIAKLRAMAGEIQTMQPGRQRDIATALMMKSVADLVPKSIWKKIALGQTMAMLLNPKTFIRNLLGNSIFMAAENVSETLAVGLDVATSLRTGQRTVALPDIPVQAKGFAKGLAEGTEEALLGINLRDMGTRFDLPRNSVFDKGVLKALERTMAVALRATDQAYYQAAYSQSLRQQTKLAKVSEPDAYMIERAHLMGLYRTFQDENAVSRMFVGLKRALNAGGDFGVGDMTIKFPKTPGSLLHHGIEYSPFGTVQALYHLVRPLMGKRVFDQEAFVRSTARSLTGSSLLVGTGVILAKLGLATGRPEKDRDVRELQKRAGIRPYQLNVDALKRFFSSGLVPDPEVIKNREGDQWVTYDWAQPLSVPLALGVNIGTDREQSAVEKTLDLAERAFEASETLARQPLVTGLRTLAGRGSITEGVAQVFQGVPATFVPTLLNQIRQLTDNIARNTRHPNYFLEALKKAQGRIPDLWGVEVAGRLPERVNTLGETQEIFQNGSNSFFNVFLNPSFVNEYFPDSVSRMVLDIYERSGETVQFPRAVRSKIRVGPDNIELTPDQYTEYQRYVGEKTKVLFEILSDSDAFRSLPEEVQAKELQGLLTDINTAAKIELFGHRPKRVSGDVKSIIMDIGADIKRIRKNAEATTQIEFETVE